MVYGIAYCPLEKQECLGELGFADSKTLTDEKRRELLRTASGHSDWFGWMLRVISPNSICNSMLNVAKYSLNAVSHDAAAGLVRRALSEGVDVREVYVDTVGPPDKYRAKLQAEFPDLSITVAKKADATYPIVSAASVCAKVARDGALEQWRFAEGLDVPPEAYGSGYPNDPVTRKFLTENVDSVFGFPSLVRFSWATADKVLEARAAAAVDWPEEEEAEETQSIRSFFKRGADGSPRAAPPKDAAGFFADRALLQVASL